MSLLYDNSIRIPIIISAIVGVIVWIGWIVHNKEKWLYAVIPLSYLIDVLIFTSLAQMGVLQQDLYRMWNDAVRLHGIFMAILWGIARILLGFREKRWK